MASLKSLKPSYLDLDSDLVLRRRLVWITCLSPCWDILALFTEVPKQDRVRRSVVTHSRIHTLSYSSMHLSADYLRVLTYGRQDAKS